MPRLVKSKDQPPVTGIQNIPSSTSITQPWWQALGNDGIPSSRQKEDSSMFSTPQQSQNTSVATIKNAETNASPQSVLEGSNNGQKLQQLGANSQMELAGHSIMFTSYPHADQYVGLLTYGAPVHPQILGYHPARMPLPLEMEEEPVYVNAKQYHGILRRRQMRAKAELEKKLVKNRKPYLHESRHRHAMRRARGTGGRFLNTKKPDSNAKNSASGEQSNYGEITLTPSVSSASAHLSSSGEHDSGGSAMQSMHKEQFLLNGYNTVHGLALYYPENSTTTPGDGHFRKDNWNSVLGDAPLEPSSRK